MDLQCAPFGSSIACVATYIIVESFSARVFIGCSFIMDGLSVSRSQNVILTLAGRA